MRKASISRTTQETEISVELDLDGDGRAEINSGVGFFDHMLAQIARHALIDLSITAKGDLHIDDHHTVEDTGIAFGQALRTAIADARGITRYGHAYVAMDECLSRAALDVSGRAFLVWRVDFTRDKIGSFDTELVREFFQAVATNAQLTLHVENLYGDNNHHIAESCFKAWARALRMAVSTDARQPEVIPSTKGSIG